ncbi:hypothetical protein BDQ94DRAFT_153255 [Aspergillus welwitschiae]|uniref:Uncharacterized protein n=1 Tax=Aspergillus welwitschiae TaxID=1341132 RepID=A0A3F3PLH7_9EURO|nr:hypothetical protein BDQ94DRAFT_153255 [Aspergillus welwitschiae]RDH27767.1 hypothetical protein BDQ94DRAFT_153255 [Aspergillus welwitschiae]
MSGEGGVMGMKMMLVMLVALLMTVVDEPVTSGFDRGQVVVVVEREWFDSGRFRVRGRGSEYTMNCNEDIT